MQEFDDRLRGAVARVLWQEDQWGRLRLDMLLAQGVTFSKGPPKESTDDAPTFERVMGRPPVSPYDPFGLPMALAYLEESSPGSLPWLAPDPEAPQSELDKEEAANRLLNTQRALAEAQLKAQMARAGRPVP